MGEIQAQVIQFHWALTKCFGVNVFVLPSAGLNFDAIEMECYTVKMEICALWEGFAFVSWNACDKRCIFLFE